MHGMRSTGLPPVIEGPSRVIVLGSMPSAMSLELGRYYGNPRNQFWTIVFSLFGKEPDPDYEDRIAFLKERKIALWDVIESCERKGSLDTSIQHERTNDLNGLFRCHPDIGLVVFNGIKAERSFWTNASLDSSIERRLKFITLPSTSPANTTRAEVKRTEWMRIRTYLEEHRTAP